MTNEVKQLQQALSTPRKIWSAPSVTVLPVAMTAHKGVLVPEALRGYHKHSS
jgi:hypothetical protein